MGDAGGAARPAWTWAGLLAASILLFTGALAVQIAGVVGNAWPSFEPLLLAGWSVPFLAWAVWARRSRHRAGAPWLARHATVVGLPLLVGGLLVHRSVRDVTHTVREAMTWTLADTLDSTTSDEVVLRFRDAPDHLVGIVSADVADYLGRHGEDVVDVEFEVTSSYGRRVGYHITRVGELDAFRIERSYGGCTGRCSGSPW